jgi:hypothetical protein
MQSANNLVSSNEKRTGHINKPIKKDQKANELETAKNAICVMDSRLFKKTSSPAPISIIEIKL